MSRELKLASFFNDKQPIRAMPNHIHCFEARIVPFELDGVSSRHDCHRSRFNELTEEFIYLLGGEGVVVVDPPGH